MRTGSIKELYLDELADLYDAEEQTNLMLPRLREAARAPELRQALQRHYDETRLHQERLQLIFTHWGGRRLTHRCAGLAGIVQETDDRVNGLPSGELRDAAIVAAALRLEHYEMAAYSSARLLSRRLNRADETRLLQETLDEETRAVRRLISIADAAPVEALPPEAVPAMPVATNATPPHGDKLR